jgi:hypothetical protein
MTIEHKIVVGLDDIKAVIFECRQCRTRLVMSPDSAAIPPRCPKHDCDSKPWIIGKAAEVTNDYEATTSAQLNLISAIGLLRKRNGGFRVLFEFLDERSVAASPAVNPALENQN